MAALFDVASMLAAAIRCQTDAVGNCVLALLVRNTETFTISKHVVHFFQSEALGLGDEDHDEKGANEGESLCQR